MRLDTARFRSLCVIVAAVLAMDLLMPPRGWAQPSPSPTEGASADQPVGDPPQRVGRLALVKGAVSYLRPGADQWSPAALNYPVSSGDAFWTQPNASAEIEIGASHLVMNSGTEFDVATLDETGLQATLPQGETYLRTRDLAPDESWSVQTPRGLVMLAGPGRYDIAAGDTGNPTTVTVLDGSAAVSGPGVGLRVGPGQTATITGNQTFVASVGPAQSDSFLTAMEQADRPPLRAGPAEVAEMPGGADLPAYGTWSHAPQYGEVWYPEVGPDWTPYSDGYWAYVTPWGWTWIDNEPWAFAPMHYGRWVEIGGRWAWTPGTVAIAAPPVYAPALVSFFDIGVGVGIGAGIGAALAEESIGWCPLGPHEPYRPWFHASDRYWRAVNAREVTSRAVINRHVSVRNFVNRRAMTVVPASALAGSRPIRRFAARVDERRLASARPLIGRDPVRPTGATVGVTPRLARQMHLAAAPAGMVLPPHTAAPGPAVPAGMAAAGRPMLRGPALHTTGARPHMPAAGGPHPGSVADHPRVAAHLPALRPAGARAAPPAIRHGVPSPHAAPVFRPAAARPVTAAPHPMPHHPRPAPLGALAVHVPHGAPPPRPMFRAVAPRPAFHPAAPRPEFRAAGPRPVPHAGAHGPARRP